MIRALATIVEGKSEQKAIRGLLERIIYDKLGATGISIARPFRVNRYRVIKEGNLERAMNSAVRDAEKRGSHVAALLVLLDVDDDCRVEMSQTLIARAKKATNLPVSVVLANKVIECWPLGAKKSLRGICGIREGADAPEEPESIRHPGGRSGQLSKNMIHGRRYNKSNHLPTLLKNMDIDLCRERCLSFDKFYREVDKLVSTMTQA